MSLVIEAPPENMAHGLTTVDIPELGEKYQGKVGDCWDLDDERMIIARTDRTSAFDRVICSVPGKGETLNRMSAFWFFTLKNIDGINTHIIALPHPNVSIVKKAVDTLPVEVILRAAMARSTTSTSVFTNYQRGDRRIYGIDFPDGLQPNQFFPAELGRNGVVVTPTTKAEAGEHDQMLDLEDARDRVDTKFGKGTWENATEMAHKMFDRGRARFQRVGMDMADTKYEFGFDKYGQLMVIDEMHTPDSSRIWRVHNYLSRFQQGLDPESYDKEALRNHLRGDLGYKGDGPIPVVSPHILKAMGDAYRVPFELVTGIEHSNRVATSEEIRRAVLPFIIR